MKKASFFTALFLFLPPVCAAALDKPLAAPVVGERLVFDVRWLGISIGTGILEVKEKVSLNGRPAYHIVAVAKTNDLFSSVYPVDDEIHSFFDAERFRSIEFRKKLREGRYRADERIVYDYNRMKGAYESFHNKSKKEVVIDSDVHDLVSAFFWFRLQHVPVGRSAHAIVNSEEKNWDLEMQVLRRETKELRGGRVKDTIVVEPKTRLKGVLYKRGRAWIHFTADQTRTPVWITIQTPFGPVVGALKERREGKV